MKSESNDVKQSLTTTKCSKFSLGQQILSLDRFSQPVQLNIDGRTHIPSYPGSFVTICCALIVSVYGAHKFEKWAFKKDPTINNSIHEHHFTDDYIVNLTNIEYKVAFGLIDSQTGQSLNDPNFIVVQANIVEHSHNKRVKTTQLKLHECTDQDYHQFYVPGANYESAIKEIREQNQTLYCIDDGQDLSIRGHSNLDSRKLELAFFPCKPNYTNNTCLNQTRESTMQYLGNIVDLVIIQNKQRFDLGDFSNNVDIIKESTITQFHIETFHASQWNAWLQMRKIEDEISLLNFGSTKNYNLWSVEIKEQTVSGMNQWPNYKIAGFDLFVDLDLQMTNRSTYDFLNFLGDVGGLDVVLYDISSKLLVSFQSYNYFAYLISLLFVQSTSLFQRVRSTLNTKIDEEEESAVFKRMKKQTLKFMIFTDLTNRKEIIKPSLFQMLFGWLFRNKNFKRFRKLYKRGVQKVNSDLDILKIIQQQKTHNVEVWSLLSQSHHQLASKIAEYVLSEFSSDQEAASIKKRKRLFPGIYLWQDGDVKQELKSCIDSAVNDDKNFASKQLLNVYLRQDKERNEKWFSLDPERVKELQNKRHLKQLIANNFRKQQAIARNISEPTSPQSKVNQRHKFLVKSNQSLKQDILVLDNIDDLEVAQKIWDLETFENQSARLEESKQFFQRQNKPAINYSTGQNKISPDTHFN